MCPLYFTRRSIQSIYSTTKSHLSLTGLYYQKILFLSFFPWKELHSVSGFQLWQLHLFPFCPISHFQMHNALFIGFQFCLEHNHSFSLQPKPDSLWNGKDKGDLKKIQILDFFFKFWIHLSSALCRAKAAIIQNYQLSRGRGGELVQFHNYFPSCACLRKNMGWIFKIVQTEVLN